MSKSPRSEVVRILPPLHFATNYQEKSYMSIAPTCSERSSLPSGANRGGCSFHQRPYTVYIAHAARCGKCDAWLPRCHLARRGSAADTQTAQRGACTVKDVRQTHWQQERHKSIPCNKRKEKKKERKQREVPVKEGLHCIAPIN